MIDTVSTYNAVAERREVVACAAVAVLWCAGGAREMAVCDGEWLR